MNDKIKVTLISAIASAVVAIVPAYITASIRTDTELTAGRSDLVADVAARVTVSGVPIGTVVGSMLDPRAFSRMVGDEGSFDPQRSLWIPADGRDVPGSKYAEAISTRVPDLRGLFVRGLNYSEPDRDRLREPGTSEWADPDGNGRKPGVPQADAFGRHEHVTAGAHQVTTSNTTGFWALSAQGFNPGQPHSVAARGGTETRPKNAALFYFIKIN